MNRRLLIGTIHCFVASLAAMSRAQPAVVASTLFQQAVAKMEAAQFSEACPLLEQSYQLEAKAGTLFTLANCRELEGKIASASARYGEYLRAYAQMNATDQQKHSNRVTLAETRVHELESQLPILKLVWQGELPAGTKIHVDDFEWASHASGAALPLDPGKHTIVVKQSSAPDTQREVMLDIGQTETFDLKAEIPFVKSKAPDPTTSTAPLTPERAPQPNLHRGAGFVTLGVGGAGIVFGGIVGVLALTEKQTVNAHCTNSTIHTCDALGITAVEKMRVYANASTAGFIVGGVVFTTGVVLVVTAPKRPKEKTMTMRVNVMGLPGGGLATLKGDF